MNLLTLKSWLVTVPGRIGSALEWVRNYLLELAARLKPRRVIGLEIDGRCLRLVELTEDKAGFRLESLEVLELPEDVSPDEPAGLGSFLEQTLSGRASGRRWLACEVPTSQVIERLLALPEGAPEELAQMVRFQLERELPLPTSAASFDYAVLDIQRAGMQVVLLAAVRNELLAQRESFIRGGGFQPRLCTIDAHAAFISCRPVFERDPAQVKCLLLLGDTRAQVVFGRRRDVLFARSLDVGPGDLASEGQTPRQDELVKELRRSMDAFRVEWREEEIAGLVLTGSRAKLPGLAERLSQELQLPVEIYDPLLREGLAAAPQLAGRDGCEFAIALGVSLAALEPGLGTIDFWHPKTGEGAVGIITPQRKLALWAAGALGTVLLVALLALQVQKGILAGLEERLEQAGPEVREVKLAKEKLRLLKPWIKSGKTTLDVLRRLSLLFPPTGSAYVTKLYVSEKTGVVRMDGRAKESEQVYALILRMNNSGYFHNTGLISERTDAGQLFPFEFTLSSQVKGLQEGR